MVQNPNPIPPSEPRAPSGPVTRVSLGEPIGLDPPARVQMIVALVLGLLLVAIPLYLWRRPRAEGLVGTSDDNKGAAPPVFVDAGAVPSEVHAPAVTLGDPLVLECHDPGSKRTPSEQCDHLVAFEKAFAKAIEDAATCVPTSAAGGGVLPFVADVSFGRRRGPITISIGKEGRTIRSTKTGNACATAIRRGIPEPLLDSLPHAHARYKVQLVATYPPAGAPR